MTLVTAYCFTDSIVSFGEISFNFLISFILKFIESFELSKYFIMKTIKKLTIATRIETAMNELNANITQDNTSQAKHPSPEKILFFDKSSAYSEGSALFIIYDKDVTSESSFIIQYKTTEIIRSNKFGIEPITLSSIVFERISFGSVISTVHADQMKYKKITATTSIKEAEAIKIFLALKYFCKTQTGLSTKKDTRFQSHKKIQTTSGLFN